VLTDIGPHAAYLRYTRIGLAFHTQLNCHARSLGRREALAGLLLFLPVAAAQAAIPSQEEYKCV
jgi:hypothetical protein